MIRSNGPNDKNVTNRRNLALETISQIFSMLQTISLRYYYVKIGLSKLLLNSESWHRLFKFHMRHCKTFTISFSIYYSILIQKPEKIYIIESGKIPIRFLISMYWLHILHVKKSDMLYKKFSQVQGDWVKLLEADKYVFKINLMKRKRCPGTKFKNT